MTRVGGRGTSNPHSCVSRTVPRGLPGPPGPSLTSLRRQKTRDGPPPETGTDGSWFGQLRPHVRQGGVPTTPFFVPHPSALRWVFGKRTRGSRRRTISLRRQSPSRFFCLQKSPLKLFYLVLVNLFRVE